MVLVCSVSKVSPLVSSDVSRSDGINKGIKLGSPDQFLARVVECKSLSNGGLSDGFSTLELKLFDKVFVGDLGELTTFGSIKVDIIDVKGCVGKNWGWWSSSCGSSITLGEWTEFDFKFHFMVVKWVP